MACLKYGIDSSAQLEAADGMAAIECGTPRGKSLDDPAAAVAVALDEPLEYPALARSIIPSDQVVLALQQGIPKAADITAAVIGSLVGGGLDPDGITVLSPLSGAEDPCRLVAEPIRERISLLKHDPDDRDKLAYLAATDAGDPIVLNRALHDADLVLPIGCLHGEWTSGYWGVHGPIFPTFSDRKTLARFCSVGCLDPRGKFRKRLLGEVEHVAWLLGITYSIQLIPAADDGVLHVLAGQSEAVGARGRELYQAAWSCPPQQPAGLVVAAIPGDANQQTWENVGRALQTASELVEEGGAIAVCCELDVPPGPAIQRLLGAESRDAALRRICRDRPPDALPAAQLARALDRGKVYLLSRLGAALVEGLDMIPITNADELARLTSRHSSCILLANASRAIPAVAQ